MKLFGKKNRLDRYAWMYNGANYLQRTNPSGLDLNDAEKLTDGGFESSVWSSLTNCTVAQSTTQKHSGTYSMKVTTTGADAVCRSELVSQAGVLKLTGEVWVFIPASSSSKNVLVGITNQALSSIIFNNVGIITADTWVKIVVNGITPGTQTGLRLFVKLNGGTSGDIFYVDDCSLTQAYDAIALQSYKSTNTATAQRIFSCRNGNGWTTGHAAGGLLQITLNDGVTSTVTDGVSVSCNGKLTFFGAVLDRIGNGSIYFNQSLTKAVSISGVGKVLSNGLAIGADPTLASLNFNGNVGQLQVIRFSSLPADGGASIIADAYNRFKLKKPFAKNYPGGTIVLDLDSKDNGIDRSAYGNYLTPVGTLPPGIIRI